MPDAVSRAEAEPISDAEGVFSKRLVEFLTRLQEGQTPNSGRFCSYCFNPLPSSFEGCDHCGLSVAERPAVESLPPEVIEMERQKLRRESLVVNSFAYLGLGLGLALFLGLVAIGVLYLDRAFWFFLVSTVVFLVGSRLLAGILGGVIGDELGYRYASKHLAEDWAAYLARRENTQRQPALDDH